MPDSFERHSGSGPSIPHNYLLFIPHFLTFLSFFIVYSTFFALMYIFINGGRVIEKVRHTSAMVSPGWCKRAHITQNRIVIAAVNNLAEDLNAFWDL